jgi:hypothetical protein
VCVNLICPALDYGGNYGKSRISNLHVFAEKIANTTVAIAREMPTFHGYGYAESEKAGTTGEKEKTLEDYVYDLLYERWETVKRDSSQKVRERWTQSSVWYNLRPILIKEGYRPKEDSKSGWAGTRRAVQGMISRICEERLLVPREALGIFASPWAVMYYDGEAYPVDQGVILELAQKGTDIIFIEKLGIVKVLSSFADEHGIALVNSKGRLTKYAKELVKVAKKSGAKVSILTDYDAIGIQIAGDVKDKMIPRLGINRKDTLQYFQQHGFPELSQQDVEEEYDPSVSTDHMEDGEYLAHKRIELDSILTKVGAKAFWEYVVNQLIAAIPEGRDYNRIISNPKPTHENGDLYPDTINDILNYLEALYDTITFDKWTEIESRLENVKGELYRYEDKTKELKDELKPIVAENKSIKLIAKKFQEIVELIRIGKLPSLKKDR